MAVLSGSVSAAHAATASSITGVAFQDVNHNGIQDAGETPFSGGWIFLSDGSGTALTHRLTDSAGRYRFDGLAVGAYVVEYDDFDLRNDWVPTTTGSLEPRLHVQLDQVAVADFGWRRIVRSTDPNQPLSSYTGPNGLRAEVFNDIVPAHDVYDATMRQLVGVEAPQVVVRLDFGSTSSAATSVAQINGKYSNYRANVNVTYLAWLDDHEVTLSHEYGHAWSLYHAYITQQDTTLAGYLQARGLGGDPRVDGSYAWSAREMIADDYRQLFGSDIARSGNALNGDIPPAEQVTGLQDYLRDTFTTPAAGTGSPAGPAPAPPISVSGLAMEPSPVKTSGTARVTLNVAGSLTVRILDGKETVVKTLLSASAASAGQTTVAWDRTSASGRRVKAGTYTLEATANDAAGNVSGSRVNFKVA